LQPCGNPLHGQGGLLPHRCRHRQLARIILEQQYTAAIRMKLLFSTLPRNTIECFKGRMLIWVLMTIHWFSDFVAGALIGTVVGVVVGNRFSRSQM
jgi:hypothetical protein